MSDIFKLFMFSTFKYYIKIKNWFDLKKFYLEDK